MRVVLDTNVVISGVFFGGVPGRVLEAWRDGRFQLVVSTAILSEYERVGERLSRAFPGVSLEPFIALIMAHAQVVDAPELPAQVSSDPDDDKFLACALAAGCGAIVSGDRHLLDVGEHAGVEVLTPADILARLMG